MFLLTLQAPHTYFDIQQQLHPSLIELLEADVFGVLPEALPAEVQVVLSDEAVAVGAGAAETQVQSC